VTHAEQVQQLHQQLRNEADAKPLTLRTNVSIPSTKRPGKYVQRQRWFTVVNPDAMLVVRARAFTKELNALLRVSRVRAELDEAT
jgi:hypothetical protein